MEHYLIITKKHANYNSNLKSLCDVCSPLLYFSGPRLPPSPRLILIRNRLNTAHGSFRSTLQKVVTFFPEMFPLSASFFFTNTRRGETLQSPRYPILPTRHPLVTGRAGRGGKNAHASDLFVRVITEMLSTWSIK